MEFKHDLEGLFRTYNNLTPMAKEDQDRLWLKFRLDWNYNSNRIEGNTLTYNETEALLILGTEPRRMEKDIREMKAHDLGISYLQELAASDRVITETDIRDLNKIILKENYFIETETADGNKTRKEIVPGHYKTLPNHVRLRGGGVHEFAEPHEVPQRMEAVMDLIRNYVSGDKEMSLPQFLAILHQDFINTHPFDDGNGRVVRMLLNYVCIKLGWPPVIIKNAHKADYIAALEQWDKGDQEPLVLLMHNELCWSLNKSIRAARGEDIEDPDDIDKEIDLFVSEETANFDPIINREKIIITNYETVQKRLFSLLETMSETFESYSVHESYTYFDAEKRKPFQFFRQLGQSARIQTHPINDKSHVIELTLFVNAEDRTITNIVDISSHLRPVVIGKDPFTKLSTKYFLFPDSVDNEIVTNVQANNYCRSIVSYVMKQYKQLRIT